MGSWLALQTPGPPGHCSAGDPSGPEQSWRQEDMAPPGKGSAASFPRPQPVSHLGPCSSRSRRWPPPALVCGLSVAQRPTSHYTCSSSELTLGKQTKLGILTYTFMYKVFFYIWFQYVICNIQECYKNYS